MILGTAAYMSPEQARGKRWTSGRTFGHSAACCTSCSPGRQAFQGETTTEILAAVLRGEPDWQALPETTPLSIRALLRRCLQKEMNKRARDAGDARIEIEEALAAPATAETDRGAERRTLWAAGSCRGPWRLAVLAVVTGLAVWNLKPSPSPRVTARQPHCDNAAAGPTIGRSG